MPGQDRQDDERWSEVGLTLIEMLVVLAIIGVAASATVLGVGAATRAPSAQSEATALADAVQAAADLAMVSDASVLLEWDPRGYRLVPGETRHRLPPGIRLAGAGRAAIGPAPLSLVVTGGEDRWTVSYDGLRAEASRPPT